MGIRSSVWRQASIALFLAVALLCAGGCGGGAGGGATSSGGRGAIVLTFEHPSGQASGLIPSSTSILVVDLQNTQTGASVIRPVVLTLDTRQATTSTTLSNIEQGSYTVVVTAKDSAGAVVGSGSTRVSVSAGVDTTAQVNVTPSGSTGRRVVVCNKGDGTFSVIDSATERVLVTKSVGGSPFGVDWTPDGSKFLITEPVNKTIYVYRASDYTQVGAISMSPDAPYDITLRPNSSNDGVGFVTCQSSVMKKINYNDLTSTVGWIQPSGILSYVLMGPAGSYIYALGFFPSDNAGQAQQIDRPTLTAVGGPVTTGDRPLLGVLNTAGTTIYTANEIGRSVSVIRTATMNVVKTIAVGSGPTGIDILPLGTKVFVANTADNTVSVIETVGDTVTATIPGFSQPLRIAALDDGAKVFVVNKGGNSVAVVNPTTHAITGTISVGSTPNGISIEP